MKLRIECPQCKSKWPLRDDSCKTCGTSLDRARLVVSFRTEESPVKQKQERTAFAEEAGVAELAGLYHMLYLGSPGTAHDFFEKYGDRMQELEERLGPERTKLAQKVASTWTDLYESTFY